MSSSHTTIIADSDHRASAFANYRSITITPRWMQSYKNKFSYNLEWRSKWSWLEYDDGKEGIVCSLSKVSGKTPVQAMDAWITHPMKNH